jgi:peptidoglycan/LPS O-acetylase OafA/YrhL
MKDKILWVDNIKVIGLLGIMTFHFWPQEYGITFHVGTLSVLKLPIENGFQGSFLFFIASGLGLTLLQKKRSLGLRSFLWSRFLRIYIPYWLTIIMVIFLARAGYNVYSISIYDPLAFLSNILLVQIKEVPIIQPHLWFLFTLIQMYLFFPLLFQVANWSKNVGMTVAVVLFIFRTKVAALAPTFFSAGTFIWLFPFYLGMYLAFCLVANRPRTERVLDMMFPFGVVLWLIGTIAYYQPQFTDISFLLVSCGLLISIYKIAKYDWRSAFINKISYETYLVHITILAMTNFYLSKYPVLVRYFPFLLGSLLVGTILQTLNKSIRNGAAVLWRESSSWWMRPRN